MSLLKTGAVQVGQSNTASNNFHWRNLLDGLLRLSRGNAGAPITDVMLVKADNSVEFPGGINGGFAKEYVSAEQTITSAGLITLTHGLGVVPKLFRATIICKTSENGYSVGDTVEVPVATDFADTTALNKGMGLTPDSTNIAIRLSAAASVFQQLNKTTGVSVHVTNANWRLIVRAWA